MTARARHKSTPKARAVSAQEIKPARVGRAEWCQKAALDTNLSARASRLGTILALKFVNEESGAAWPSQRTLAKCLGVQPKSGVQLVRNLVAELASAGYLAFESGSGNKSTRYWLTEPKTGTHGQANDLSAGIVPAELAAPAHFRKTWSAATDAMLKQLGSARFGRWIEKLRVLSADEGRVVIEAPTKFHHAKIVEDPQLGEQLTDVLRKLDHTIEAIEFIVHPREAAG